MSTLRTLPALLSILLSGYALSGTDVSETFPNTFWLEIAETAQASLTKLSGIHAEPPNFHGFEMLGTGTMEKPVEVARLVSLLHNEIANPLPGISLCFIPRHAVTIKAAGSTFDFLICYECSNIRVMKDSHEIYFGTINGSSKRVVDLLFAAYVSS
ncbi:MAG: hypothetical protein R3E82_23280 [Pseudomonadales bacterium]